LRTGGERLDDGHGAAQLRIDCRGQGPRELEADALGLDALLLRERI